jgi:hypothetical protein
MHMQLAHTCVVSWEYSYKKEVDEALQHFSLRRPFQKRKVGKDLLVLSSPSQLRYSCSKQASKQASKHACMHLRVKSHSAHSAHPHMYAHPHYNRYLQYFKRALVDGGYRSNRLRLIKVLLAACPQQAPTNARASS